MIRIVRAVAALVALIALVGGIPYGLIRLIGWPLPRHLPSLAEVQVALTPPIDQALILSVLACAAWWLWAHFTIAVTIETYATLRGLRLPKIRMLGPSQVLAAMLVSAVVSTVVAASASATTRHDVRISAGHDDEPYGDPEYWIEQSRRYLPDMPHIREPRFPRPGWRIRPPHVVRLQPPSEEHRPVRPKPTPKVERPPATPREQVQPAPRLIPRPAKSSSEAETSPDVPLPSRTAKPTPTDTPTRGPVAPTPATGGQAVPEAHPTPVAPDVPARDDSEVVVAFGSGALVGISFAALRPSLSPGPGSTLAAVKSLRPRRILRLHHQRRCSLCLLSCGAPSCPSNQTRTTLILRGNLR